MSGKKIRQQFADTMLEVGRTDPKLVVLVGDVSQFSLQPFAKACPGRFYNIGICEPTIVSMAAGLAKAGFHPVAHTIAPFILERSFEQIKLDFCYQLLPGTIITVGGAFDYSNLGCTHHCYGDFALIKSLPNTQAVYPGSAEEFDLLFRATYNNTRLTYFRIPEAMHGQSIPAGKIELGKAVRMREGGDVTIAAAGPMLGRALQAAELLAARKIQADVIYLHTMHPLDLPAIRESALRTGRVVTVEDHNKFGGMGSDVLRGLHDLPGLRLECLGVETFLHEYGSFEEHCASLGLTAEGIAAAAERTF